MPTSSDDRGPVELLADDFLARHKRGEKPTIKEYCERRPELADEIRDIFEALLMVEDLKPDAEDVSGSFGDSVRMDGKRLEHVGDYRILREIGRGGMGVVYEAEQQALGRRVALKVLPKSLAGDGKALIRFQREAKATARMHHTNIVPVFDVGQDGELVYYAMQLIQGQGLDLVIDDLKRLRDQSNPAAQADKHAADKSIAASLILGQFDKESLVRGEDADPNETAAYAGSPPSSAVLPGQSELSSVHSNKWAYHRSVAQIGLQTAGALAYAHARGIVHRDIKPANLLLDAAGNVWVSDFGLAKTGDGGVTHTGDILGTIRYMSPERFRGQCDVRSDVYALGLTLYEMLTLKPAYASADRLKLIEQIRQTEPPSPRSLDPRIPRDLETIVVKAIDKDPRRRYQSADELAEDLQRFVADEPIKARRAGAVERVFRWCRRNPAVASLSAAVLVLMALGTTLSLMQAIRATVAEGEAARQRDVALASERDARAARDEAAKERDNVARANQSLGRLAAERRRTLYATSMNLAQAAWDGGNPARTFELLSQQVPKTGEDDLRGFEWHYWKRFTRLDQKTVQLPGSFNVDSFRGKLSPDGTRVAAFISNPTDSTTSLKLWEADTGKEIWSVPAAGKVTFAVMDFSLDGRRLVTSRFFPAPGERPQPDRTELRVWDTATGKDVYANDFRDKGSFFGQALAPDGSRLALRFFKPGALSSSSLSVRRLPDGEEIFHYPPDESKSMPMVSAFSPDGKRVAAATYEQPNFNNWTLRVWDLDGGQELQKMSLPDASMIPDVRFSPEGARIVTRSNAESHDQVILWDWATGKKLQVLDLPGPPNQFNRPATVAFEPGGKLLAVAQNSQVHLFDVDPKRSPSADALLRTIRGHEKFVQGAAFGRDGSRLVTLDALGTVKQWDPAARDRRLRTPFGSPVGSNLRRAIVFPNPDGSRVVSVPSAGELDRRFLINDASGHVLSELALPPGHCDGMEFSLDSRTFAFLWHEDSFAFTLYVWDAIAGKELWRQSLPAGSATYVTLSPDGSRVAVTFVPSEKDRGRQPPTLDIWETATGRKLLSQRDLHTDDLFNTSYSPDGRWIAVTAWSLSDKVSRIVWLDATTGAEAAALKFGSGSMGPRVFGFSRDGRRVAATQLIGGTTSLLVWEVDPILRGEARDPVVTLHGHGGKIDCFAFSPDNRRILTAGGGAVKLWDADSGRELLTLKSGEVPAGDAYFSTDGHTIWAGLDENGRLWGWDGTPVVESKNP